MLDAAGGVGGSARVMTDAEMLVQQKRYHAQQIAQQQRQAQQAQAATATKTARQQANTALGNYRGKVRNHQQHWAAQNHHRYRTEQEAYTAWKTAWDSSSEGQEAEQMLAPYIANYSAAVQHELRLTAQNTGGDQAAINSAVNHRVAELKAEGTGGTPEDTALDGVVDEAAGQVNSELPELRQARIDVHDQIGAYNQAQTNLNNVLDRRDRALRSVHNMGLREEIRDSFQDEVETAQTAFDTATTTLRTSLTNEWSIAIADGVLSSAQQSLANLKALPPQIRNAERGDVLRALGNAQHQRSEVLAGHYEALQYASPSQIDDVVRSVMFAHPELLALESDRGMPFGMEIFIQGEVLKHRPEIDTNMALLPSIAADPKTPQWMKDLIAKDPVSAALIASLEIKGPNNTEIEVYSLAAEGDEKHLAEASPLTFALLKYAGGTLEMPASTLADPQPADFLRYGQEALAKAFEQLNSIEGKTPQQIAEDQQKISDLQLTVLASGNVRIGYLRGEWQRVTALESPGQSVDKIMNEYLDPEDFNNPDYEAKTEVGKFMKELSINMQAAALVPGLQGQIWDAIGGDIKTYIGQQADYIQAHYGDEQELPAAVGEWQKQMAQFAPPPVADAIIDVTVSEFSPTMIGRMGGGRMTDGLQLLADRAGREGGDKIADWATAVSGDDAYSVPLRDLLSVKEDGTGITLGRSLLTEIAGDGADRYALEEMRSWFEASASDVSKDQAEQVSSEQVKLFDENRNQKLQDIFDGALRDNGDVFTQRLNFGTDPASDNEYGHRLGLTPDNPDADVSNGEALYTDPGKLEKIQTLKQIDWISRGSNLPVDVDSLIPIIVRGDPLPQDENLKKINQIRDWIEEVGGEEATITFTPAIYTSETRGGVQAQYLIRVEGDKNHDGQITRDETTTPGVRGSGSKHLDDEDMVIDASAVIDDNPAWKYNDFGDFQKDNKRLDDHGRLYMVNTDDLLLHDNNGDGHVDNINFDGVDAAITTTGERIMSIVDTGVGVLTAVATVASFTPLAPIAAPVAFAGGTYLGVRGAMHLGEMHEHGQSWNGREGYMEMAGVAAALLPLGAGAIRAGYLFRSGMEATAAMRTGFGAFYVKNPMMRLFPAPYVADGQMLMASGGRALSVAKGFDTAAMAIGTPLLATSAHDTLVNWNAMSGWERTSSLLNVFSGFYATGMGAHNWLAARRGDGQEAFPSQPDPFADGDPAVIPAGDTDPAVRPATASYTGKQVANLTAAHWNAFTEAEIRAIPADHVTQIRVDQVALLSTDTIGAFTGDQMAALPPNRLRQLTEAQIGAIARESLASIAPHRLAAMSKEQFAAITREQQGYLTVQQLSKVTPDQLAAMTAEQLGGFTPEQRHAFSPRQMSKLGTEQLAALNDPWLRTPYGTVAVNYEPVTVATPYRDKPWSALTAEEFASVPGQRLARVSPEQLERVSPEVFAAVAREQQLWLTPHQLTGVTRDQLAALDVLQLAAFSPEQRAVFTPKQLSGLNEAQAGALTWPWFNLSFGPRSTADIMAHPRNLFNPIELPGVPSGEPASPVHEVSHFYPGRNIHTMATLNGVEVGARILTQNDRIVLVTGFSVAKGMPETDGPPGTALLGRALRLAGKEVTYVTDRANAPILRAVLEALGEPTTNVEVFSAPHFGPFASRRAARLLNRIQPDAVMSIELPGRSIDGKRRNMRGVVIDGFNAPLDAIVLEANKRSNIVTLGVGDGGNESGMGVVRDLVPAALDGSNMASNVPVDYLITASVSNWGAEAVAAVFVRMLGQPELLHTPEQQHLALSAAADAGAVDGVTRMQVASADGLSWEAHQGWHILREKALDVTAFEPIFITLMDSSDGGLYAGRTYGDILVDATGRRLVRIFGLDHGNAPYGKIAVNPERGPVEIGRLTNNVLQVLNHALRNSSSSTTIAMACNTACTGIGFDANLGDANVINLVQITAREMVRRNSSGQYVYGDHPVSLSTSGTEDVHAYRDEVMSLDPNVSLTEIGASEREIPGTQGKLTPDLADIVNRLRRSDKPSDAEIRSAVDFYVDQMPTDATSVWLTCTHYPALRSYIEASLARRGMNIPVIDPMPFQVRETINRLGIETIERRPAHFQRSRPPIVITSGELGFRDATGQAITAADGTPFRVKDSEVESTLRAHPDWSVVDDQLTSARAVLEREDVRIIHVDDFANVSDAKMAEIRHAIYRANNPQDGTLHELSVRMYSFVDSDGKPVLGADDKPLSIRQNEVESTLRQHNDWRVDPSAPEGKWVPIEAIVRDAEIAAYKEIDAQLQDQGGFQRVYENVLRAIAGYGPVPEAGSAPAGPSPTPPSGWRVTLRNFGPQFGEYGALLATTTTLAATVPPQYLMLANGAAWVMRGLGTLPMALAPKRFGMNPETGRVNTNAGRILRAWNGMTFIANGAYHSFTYSNLSGVPSNQLYAVSDHGSLFQNIHEARTGDTTSPPRWARLTTLGFANAANVALMPIFSIPAGFAAWGPNILFGGGTAFLTYKAMGGKAGTPTHTRIANGATAVGLMAFGVNYVLTVALPRLNGQQPQAGLPAQAIKSQAGDQQQQLVQLEDGVYLDQLGHIVLGPDAITTNQVGFDPDLLAPVGSLEQKLFGLGEDGKVIVMSGDTLWQIAQRFYGNGADYVEIVRNNRGQISDPDLIYPDQQFRIFA